MVTATYDAATSDIFVSSLTDKRDESFEVDVFNLILLCKVAISYFSNNYDQRKTEPFALPKVP